MRDDREILRAIRGLQARQPSVDEEKVFETLKEELRRHERLDPDSPPLGAFLRARLYLREKKVGTLPIVLGVLTGVLLTTALVTPADRALAGWISGIFETGRPGGQPSLTTPIPNPDAADRHSKTEGVVLGTAHLTQTKIQAELTALATPSGRCIGLGIPGRGFHLSDCSPASTRLPAIRGMASVRPAGLGGILILGTAPAGTGELVIAPDGLSDSSATTQAALIDPSAEVRARAGISGRTIYFAAHLAGPIPPRLVAIAKDGSGRPLGRSAPTSTDAITSMAPATNESEDGFIAADPP